MFTFTAKPNDIIREVAAIQKVLNGKKLKAYKVFKVWAQRNKSDKPIILTKQTYLINNNEVQCWWIGKRIKNINFIFCKWVVETFIIDGKRRYIGSTGKQPIVYTNHFVKRLRERHNQSFLQWFEEYIIDESTQPFMHYKDSNDFITIINNMYVLGEEKDGVKIIETTLTDDQLYENQIINKQQMKDFSKKKDEEFDELTKNLSHIKYHDIITSLKML